MIGSLRNLTFAAIGLLVGSCSSASPPPTQDESRALESMQILDPGLHAYRPSAETASAPTDESDAGGLPDCYPYASEGDQCRSRCDPGLPVPYPQSHPHCSQSPDWPLLCNPNGECYPVEPSEFPGR